MDDKHFKMIFWFIVFTTILVLGYVFVITFMIIPKENQRFVDISLGFLLGSILAPGISYLVGGNPGLKKPTKAITGQMDNSEEEISN